MAGGEASGGASMSSDEGGGRRREFFEGRRTGIRVEGVDEEVIGSGRRASGPVEQRSARAREVRPSASRVWHRAENGRCVLKVRARLLARAWWAEWLPWPGAVARREFERREARGWVQRRGTNSQTELLHRSLPTSLLRPCSAPNAPQLLLAGGLFAALGLCFPSLHLTRPSRPPPARSCLNITSPTEHSVTDSVGAAARPCTRIAITDRARFD